MFLISCRDCANPTLSNAIDFIGGIRWVRSFDSLQLGGHWPDLWIDKATVAGYELANSGFSMVPVPSVIAPFSSCHFVASWALSKVVTLPFPNKNNPKLKVYMMYIYIPCMYIRRKLLSRPRSPFFADLKPLLPSIKQIHNSSFTQDSKPSKRQQSRRPRGQKFEKQKMKVKNFFCVWKNSDE